MKKSLATAVDRLSTSQLVEKASENNCKESEKIKHEDENLRKSTLKHIDEVLKAFNAERTSSAQANKRAENAMKAKLIAEKTLGEYHKRYQEIELKLKRQSMTSGALVSQSKTTASPKPSSSSEASEKAKAALKFAARYIDQSPTKQPNESTQQSEHKLKPHIILSKHSKRKREDKAGGRNNHADNDDSEHSLSNSPASTRKKTVPPIKRVPSIGIAKHFPADCCIIMSEITLDGLSIDTSSDDALEIIIQWMSMGNDRQRLIGGSASSSQVSSTTPIFAQLHDDDGSEMKWRICFSSVLAVSDILSRYNAWSNELKVSFALRAMSPSKPKSTPTPSVSAAASGSGSIMHATHHYPTPPPPPHPITHPHAYGQGPPAPYYPPHPYPAYSHAYYSPPASHYAPPTHYAPHSYPYPPPPPQQ